MRSGIRIFISNRYITMDEDKEKFQTFRQMITLSAVGASGKTICLSDAIDWQAVILYAQEQGVLPLIGCALLHNPDVVCKDELREQLLSAVREASSKNLIRRIRVMQLLAQMEAERLNVILLKGYAVADCYRYSECRDSTDVDILISVEQEHRVYAFLKKQGFQITPRGKADHHAVGLHPKFGKVEIHVQLYNELVRDVWFQNIAKEELVTEPPVSISRNGEFYQTLGYTDHLIFLTLHMVKHFIRSGMNVRMMIDVAQFYAVYQEKIDVDRYRRILKALHYDTVIGCVFGIMIDTGGFECSEFPMRPKERPSGEFWILQDLESGGNMGVKEEKRILNAYEYTRQILLYKNSSGQYFRYMFKHKLRSAWCQIFPTKDELAKLYPKVKKNGFLHPVFRVHRMFVYPMKKIRSGILKEQIRTGTSQLPTEAQRRMEMFKMLNMLP